jgi:hypothetical protein
VLTSYIITNRHDSVNPNWPEIRLAGVFSAPAAKSEENPLVKSDLAVEEQ